MHKMSISKDEETTTTTKIKTILSIWNFFSIKSSISDYCPFVENFSPRAALNTCVCRHFIEFIIHGVIVKLINTNSEEEREGTFTHAQCNVLVKVTITRQTPLAL